MRIVDLSRVIEGRVPYPLFQTHPKVSFTRVESSAFIDRRGKTVDQLPVESFVKSAVLLDVSGKTVGEVDDEDLEAAEEAAGISIRDGEAVILNTCWDKVSIKRRTRFPGLSGNAVDYLLFKRIAEIGVDCPSVDKGDSMRSHRALLRKGVPVIEGLCNLVEIDQSRFRFLMLPLRLRAAISPVRVLALLDEAYW